MALSFQDVLSECRFVACVIAAVLSVGECVIGQSSVIVEVNADDVDRADVPVEVLLPDAFADAASVYMQRLDTGRELISQRSAGNPRLLTWMIDGRLAAGQSRRYRVLASGIPRRAPETVTCRDTGKALTMSVGGRPVLTYHTAVLMPPRELDPVFQRSGFLHPVMTPAGNVVTADFPADHAHQHGIFFAWKQTEFEGRSVDFWNQADKTGTVQHVSVNHVQSGPVFAEFDVTLRHDDISASEGPKPVLNEQWTVRLYSHRDVHLFDLTSRQQCSSESPLKMLEYHYGGMGYRGPTAWLGEESGFVMRTSEGAGRKEGNHTRPNWVDSIGPTNSQMCGLRVVQHPDNFRFPQPVRLHPSKPYFVFSPEVLGEFSIEPEQVYESRYRYIVFDGEPSLAAEALATDYVKLPTVRIVE